MAERLHRLLDESFLVFLVVNDEIRMIPDQGGFPADDLGENGMEGADPKSLVAPDQFSDAGAHFLGRLLGEGHGQNFMRRDVSLPDHVGDLMREDAGFPAARAREDEDGAVRRFDGPALFRIQFVE